MLVRSLLLTLALSPILSASAFAEPDAKIPPIEEWHSLVLENPPFKQAGRGKPIEIKSADDAAKYFDEESTKTIRAKIDFKQQILLIFAWRGSGRGRLSLTVAESYPEQITFTFTPNLTRDLLPHTAVYALRSNVKWSMK